MLARLIDLRPYWIRWEERNATERDVEVYRATLGSKLSLLPKVETLEEAQGIRFNCPKCGRLNTEVGQHIVLVSFADRGIPDHLGTHNHEGQPVRWQVMAGTSFGDLTLSPSIDLTRSNPNCWHGFIQNGAVL